MYVWTHHGLASERVQPGGHFLRRPRLRMPEVLQQSRSAYGEHRMIWIGPARDFLQTEGRPLAHRFAAGVLDRNPASTCCAADWLIIVGPNGCSMRCSVCWPARASGACPTCGFAVPELASTPNSLMLCARCGDMTCSDMACSFRPLPDDAHFVFARDFSQRVALLRERLFSTAGRN